ncbi:hypothetical protein ACFORJ_07995 [Corynebacterium hansenii]|uniref:CopG family transcriptional regulator n=1 Tax=Corynebacterium hansenii TaxID=394964 RepID=A0ABV7ZPJ3_9CORY|nr:hypothetical protein [Corynebacterium hansenii]WJZ00692.1 hypothetical protein CHAN_10460 [Corynebacterium hansenii]
MEDARIWLTTQIRRRAAAVLGDDWADRCYVETVADEMLADGITDINQLDAADADEWIVRGSLGPTTDDEVA